MKTDNVNSLLEQSLLYDFYGELLTEHQKMIYEDFVLNDLSLSEIADVQGITRQGVHDLVKRCNKILKDYEEKLHLVERFLSAKKKIGNINELITVFKKENNTDILNEAINKIEKISNELLEEF